MKKDSWSSYLLYLPLSIIMILVRVLPVEAVLAFGRFIGRLVCVIADRRRRITNANLKAAFGNRYSSKERARLVSQVFENFGQCIIELFLFPRMDNTYFKKFATIEHLERIEAAVKKNKGVIYLSAHYGNWELAASISAVYGYPMLALAREQRPYFLNNMLNRYREKKGTTVIKKGAQLKEMLKHLRNKGRVGVIGDQSGRQGKEMDFFGRPIFMADGAFRIAAKTGSVLLPAFNIKEGNKNRLVVEEPIAFGDQLKSEKDIEAAMLRYRDLLEFYISKDPKQWMWGNKRWKYTRVKRVLILGDGKTGHLRQAQAVADSVLKQCPGSKMTKIELLYKNKFWKNFLTVRVLLLGRFIRHPLRLLRLALKRECCEKLENVFTDIIVCCGASTRASALLLARENLAKTISIMRPVPFKESRFNLSIIPRHDSPASDENILVTQGALNLIDPEYIRRNVAKLKETVKIREGLKVGLFIGGDSKYYTLSEVRVKTLIKQLKKFSSEFNAQLLLSSSRRTPNIIDKFLHQSLDDYSRCIFKVFPNEKNFEFTIGGILGVVQVIIVTGESISMVSEAASAGAYTIVLSPKKRKGAKKVKHDLFLKHLAEQGIIRLATPDTIYEALINFQKNPGRLKKLDDREKLDKAIRERILNLPKNTSFR